MKNLNQEKPAGTPASDIDVEAIMEQVRKKVQQNRRMALEQGLQPRQFIFDDYPDEPTSGSYDSDLYVHLRQVNQPHQILGVRRVMRASFLTKLPIVGLIWKRIQYESHNLVIFYANSLAAEIVTYQRHVAGVLNRLVGWSQAKDNEIRLLQAEVNALKERIASLEAKQ